MKGKPTFVIRNNEKSAVSLIINSLLDNYRSGFVLKSNSIDLFKNYLKGKKTVPFRLDGMNRNSEGQYFIDMVPSNQPRKVLSILKYRCPGPIAEIMMFAKRQVNSPFDLYLFSAKIDSGSLLDSFSQRGYCADSEVIVEGVLSKYTVQNKDIKNESSAA